MVYLPKLGAETCESYDKLRSFCLILFLKIRDDSFHIYFQGDMCRVVLEDDEFSRHFLSGQNPFILRRVTSLPPNFHVTDHMVLDYLHRGISLEGEIKVNYTRHIV